MSARIEESITIGRASGGPSVLIRVAQARRSRRRLEGDDGHRFRLLVHHRPLAWAQFDAWWSSDSQLRVTPPPARC